MGTTHQTFTGDAKGLERELKNLQREMLKLQEENRKIALESLKAHKETQANADKTSAAAGRVVSSLKSWASGYFSVQAAIQLVNQALEEQRRLSEEAGKAQVNVAGGQAAVLKNLGDVSEKEGQRFLSNLDALRAEVGFGSVVPLQQAASSILSATGGNQTQTMDILRAAAPLFRDTPGDLAGFGGALADVQKSANLGDAKQTAALMLAIQGQARFTDLSAFKNVAPALATVDIVSDGDQATDAREGAALFAGIGSRIGDVEGSLTKTAVANLASNLEKVTKAAGINAGTTFERLEAVRKDAKLQAEVLKSGFEGAVKPAIRELVSGDGGKTGGLVSEAFGKIQASEEALDRKVQQLGGLTPELAHQATTEKLKGSREDFLRQEGLSRANLARTTLFGDGEDIGTLATTRDQGIYQYTLGMMSDAMVRRSFESHVAGGGDPLDFAIRELRGREMEIRGFKLQPGADGRSRAVMGSVDALSPHDRARVELLQQQREALEQRGAVNTAEVVQAIKEQTNATKQVGRQLQGNSAGSKLAGSRER